MDDLFVLDCTPSKLGAGAEESITDVALGEFDKSLGFDDTIDTGGKSEAPVSTMGKCFNCDGDHTLTDCTLPKNFAKIREARKRMRDSAAGSKMRYHEDACSKSKFKPGKVSSDLRKALGLDDDQLPMHIYQMRMLGYPPGWIEEGKVEQQIQMFDDRHSEEDNDYEYDHTKHIEYPGFNVKAPRGVYDECEELGYPQFDIRRNGIEAMIKYLKENARREKEENDSCKKKKQKVNHVTLDDSDCIVMENVEEAEEVIMTDDFDDCESLDALEEKKRQLLNALQNEDISIPEEWTKTDISSQESLTASSETSGFVSGSSQPPDSDLDPEPKSGATVTLGTPILSFSPYTKTPDLSSFSEGVGDHLFFENLPGYTGTYKKLKVVLAKIKEVKNKNAK